MKKRLFCLLLAGVLALSGCAGGSLPPASPAGGSPSAEAPASVFSETVSPSAPPTPSAAPSPAQTTPSGDWSETYVDFLRDNYDNLNSLCYGGISGIGFIDLDLDGTPELLLFDIGASAALGAQFFDIVDGQVVCVSANNPDLGVAYGQGYFSNLYVDANYFDDFKLMEDLKSGEQYFLVESGNGAEDFYYREDIRFGGGGSVPLTLTSLLYHYESFSFDADGNAVPSGETFTQNGQSISKGEYDSQYAALFASAKVLDYTPQGVFLWEDESYDGTAESFLALAQTALDRYVPIDN